MPQLGVPPSRGEVGGGGRGFAEVAPSSRWNDTNCKHVSLNLRSRMKNKRQVFHPAVVIFKQKPFLETCKMPA